MSELLKIKRYGSTIIITDTHVIVERLAGSTQMMVRSTITGIDSRWFFFGRYSLILHAASAMIKIDDLKREDLDQLKAILTGR